MAENMSCILCPWYRCVDLDQTGVVLGWDDKSPAPNVFMLGNMVSLMFILHYRVSFSVLANGVGQYLWIQRYWQIIIRSYFIIKQNECSSPDISKHL